MTVETEILYCTGKKVPEIAYAVYHYLFFCTPQLWKVTRQEGNKRKGESLLIKV